MGWESSIATDWQLNFITGATGGTAMSVSSGVNASKLPVLYYKGNQFKTFTAGKTQLIKTRIRYLSHNNSVKLTLNLYKIKTICPSFQIQFHRFSQDIIKQRISHILSIFT